MNRPDTSATLTRKNRAVLPILPGVLTAISLCLSSAIVLAQGTPAARGQELYEASCTGCHGKSVHDRQPRSARDVGDIRSFVARWSTELGTHWNPQQIDDVVLYLNQRFYHYPCPQPGCGRDQLSGAGTDQP